MDNVESCPFRDNRTLKVPFGVNILLLPIVLASEDAYPHSNMSELYLFLARASSRFGSTLAYRDS